MPNVRIYRISRANGFFPSVVHDILVKHGMERRHMQGTTLIAARSKAEAARVLSLRTGLDETPTQLSLVVGNDVEHLLEHNLLPDQTVVAFYAAQNSRPVVRIDVGGDTLLGHWSSTLGEDHRRFGFQPINLGPTMKTESEIRARMTEIEQGGSMRVTLAVQLDTLRWVLGEDLFEDT